MEDFNKPRCAVLEFYGRDVWEKAVEVTGDPRFVYCQGEKWWDEFAVAQGFGHLDEGGSFVRTSPRS
ncbi:hypothetical protein LGV61_01865 [Desulfurispirillum indicum]|uniref:Uncharacterized protein n=1 Tax=Desulfurispirillum indicum (strain ATCC BAA-1389 / DSM 22839 / S5) TaxID=653733 RepID=E6W766_DESIS|nr:hypothetical protein [Desulfurispirillum indicum]ADU65144.1 hypothetical protein Selin_0388 [Desulfurispirillum indicum S5]UCZ57047.1 hypothetical protein LGV61_01865 [Desulfurispirillum indicum]